MSLGDLLDAAIGLYRKNFALFAGIVAVLGVPQALISGGIRLASPSNVITNTGTSATPNYIIHWNDAQNALLLNGGNLLVGLILGTLITGALAQAVSYRYLDRPITVAQAYSTVSIPTFFRLLVASLLEAIFLVIGFALLIVPGVIFFVRWQFLAQSIVIERHGIWDGFRRSWNLTLGSFWRVFGYWIVIALLVGITQTLLGGIIGFALAFGGSGPAALGVVISSLVVVLVQPFQFGFLTLLYYDLRIRKEGYDLEHMAQQLDAYQTV